MGWPGFISQRVPAAGSGGGEVATALRHVLLAWDACPCWCPARVPTAPRNPAGVGFSPCANLQHGALLCTELKPHLGTFSNAAEMCA